MTANGQTLPGLEQQATAFKAEYENSWSFLSGDQQRVFRLRVAEARTRAAAFGSRLVGILGTTSDPARRGVILKMLERVNKVHAVLTQLHKAVQRIGFGQNESWEAEGDAFGWNDVRSFGTKAVGSLATLAGLAGSGGGDVAAPLRGIASAIGGMTPAERDKQRLGVDQRPAPAPGRQPPPRSKGAIARTRQVGPWMTVDAGFREAEAELLGEADSMTGGQDKRARRSRQEAIRVDRMRTDRAQQRSGNRAAAIDARRRAKRSALAKARAVTPVAVSQALAIAARAGAFRTPAAIPMLQAALHSTLLTTFGQLLADAGDGGGDVTTTMVSAAIASAVATAAHRAGLVGEVNIPALAKVLNGVYGSSLALELKVLATPLAVLAASSKSGGSREAEAFAYL